MGRVKEAVLASLAHPIVSSRQCAMVSVIACFSSYIDHKIRQNLYTRINIHTRQLCESSTRYRSYGF